MMVPVTDEVLREFRFEVSFERMATIPTKQMVRLGEFMQQQIAIAGDGWFLWEDTPMRDARAVEGLMPIKVVTVLQAFAMGHDVDQALDLAGAAP